MRMNIWSFGYLSDTWIFACSPFGSVAKRMKIQGVASSRAIYFPWNRIDWLIQVFNLSYELSLVKWVNSFPMDAIRTSIQQGSLLCWFQLVTDPLHALWEETLSSFTIHHVIVLLNIYVPWIWRFITQFYSTSVQAS